MTRVEEQAGALILASASARRRKILDGLGVRFEVIHPPDEETTDGSPAAVVRTNAGRKLAWCMARRPRCRILAADTVVVFNGRPIGKPTDMSEAWGWFREFSGNSQQVLTGVAYIGRLGVVREDVVESVVFFRKLSELVIGEYLGKVSPFDKAGGYDIDECGDLIIERWEGSHTNIMGLPVELVSTWFREDGVL